MGAGTAERWKNMKLGRTTEYHDTYGIGIHMWLHSPFHTNSFTVSFIYLEGNKTCTIVLFTFQNVMHGFQNFGLLVFLNISTVSNLSSWLNWVLVYAYFLSGWSVVALSA